MTGQNFYFHLASAAIALAATLVAGCEPQEGQQSSPPDADGEASDAASPDGSIADVADAQFTCSPAEPEKWIAQQYDVFSSAVAQPEPSPPPYDNNCKAKFERSCTTICDCKFVSVQCNVMAASVNSPWTKWPIVGPPGTDGKCTNLACGGVRAPAGCQAQLACVNGKCVASGGCAYSEQPDWP